MAKYRGSAAMALTIALWSFFAIAMRALGGSTLLPLDAALLRFLIPALLLAPLAPRVIKKIKTSKPKYVLGVALGSGLPHFLLSEFGGKLTSASLVGIVLPGMVPAFFAINSFIFYKQRIEKSKLISILIISIGIYFASVGIGAHFDAFGLAALMTGSFCWSIFTISIQRTIFKPLENAFVVSVFNALTSLFAIAAKPSLSNIALGQAKLSEIALAALLLGIGTGIFSGFAFAYAAKSLGSKNVSAYGSLSPVLTVVLSSVIFAEVISAKLAIGLALVLLGVYSFNNLRISTFSSIQPSWAYRLFAKSR